MLNRTRRETSGTLAFRLLGACALLLLGFAWFGRTLWLSGLGQYLVSPAEQTQTPADAVLVPAADYIRTDVFSNTLEDAAGLLRMGRAKHFVMTCADAYDVSECKLAERALADAGYQGVHIEPLNMSRVSDEVEADLAVRYLKTTGRRSAIVLLPNYKIRRLGRQYRRSGEESGIAIAIEGQNREFDPQRWWKSRQGQERVCEEFMRRFALF